METNYIILMILFGIDLVIGYICAILLTIKLPTMDNERNELTWMILALLGWGITLILFLHLISS